jgi:hypothetical protein
VLWSLSHKKLKVITKWVISPPLAVEDYGLQRMKVLYLRHFTSNPKDLLINKTCKNTSPKHTIESTQQYPQTKLA